jgi:hypothetical protein
VTRRLLNLLTAVSLLLCVVIVALWYSGDLVDHHAVDLPCLDVRQQPPHRRPLQVAAGEAAVVVAVGQADPALVPLGCDERLGALPLGVQRVELLLQPLLGALAGVDRTPDDLLRLRGLALSRGHLRSLLWVVRPKNRWPFQWLPVTALATAERER